MALVGILHPPKQPAESFVLAIDFAQELLTGEIISSRTVTARRLSDGADTGATILSGIAGGDVTICAIRVVSGAHGETHRVQMRVGTTGSNTYEHEFDVPVEER
jgi:hypothetical protein